MFVSVTFYSIKHMDIDIQGMGVLPRMGVLPHLTLLQFPNVLYVNVCTPLDSIPQY